MPRVVSLIASATEIVAAPKVYAFDTGFMCYHRGWHELRREDLGLLWEHFVLNELHGQLQTRDIRYWRDKQGHEVDFVLADRSGPPTAAPGRAWSTVRKALSASPPRRFSF